MRLGKLQVCVGLFALGCGGASHVEDFTTSSTLGMHSDEADQSGSSVAPGGDISRLQSLLTHARMSPSYYSDIGELPYQLAKTLDDDTLRAFRSFLEQGGSSFRLGQIVDDCMSTRTCASAAANLSRLASIAQEMQSTSAFLRDPEVFRNSLPEADAHAVPSPLRKVDINLETGDYGDVLRMWTEITDVTRIRIGPNRTVTVGPLVWSSQSAYGYCLGSNCEKIVILYPELADRELLSIRSQAFGTIPPYHEQLSRAYRTARVRSFRDIVDILTAAGIPTLEINGEETDQALIVKNPGTPVYYDPMIGEYSIGGRRFHDFDRETKLKLIEAVHTIESYGIKASPDMFAWNGTQWRMANIERFIGYSGASEEHQNSNRESWERLFTEVSEVEGVHEQRPTLHQLKDSLRRAYQQLHPQTTTFVNYAVESPTMVSSTYLWNEEITLRTLDGTHHTGVVRDVIFNYEELQTGSKIVLLSPNGEEVNILQNAIDYDSVNINPLRIHSDLFPDLYRFIDAYTQNRTVRFSSNREVIDGYVVAVEFLGHGAVGVDIRMMEASTVQTFLLSAVDPGSVDIRTRPLGEPSIPRVKMSTVAANRGYTYLVHGTSSRSLIAILQGGALWPRLKSGYGGIFMSLAKDSSLGRNVEMNQDDKEDPVDMIFSLELLDREDYHLSPNWYGGLFDKPTSVRPHRLAQMTETMETMGVGHWGNEVVFRSPVPTQCDYLRHIVVPEERKAALILMLQEGGVPPPLGRTWDNWIVTRTFVD